jgi:hypothetical protein
MGLVAAREGMLPKMGCCLGVALPGRAVFGLWAVFRIFRVGNGEV